GFGPCEGAVLPEAERCDNALDDDCDGTVNETDAGCACIPNSYVACYEGPGGTEDVGSCRGGHRYCDPDAQQLGPCLGQTLPSFEECLSSADDDCDGEANLGCPVWAARFGSTTDLVPEAAWGLAMTPGGHVVLVGEAGAGSPGIDFGGGPLPAAGGSDIFVAELTESGGHVFSRRFGDAESQIARSVATDAQGNLYVAGAFAGTLDFGGGVSLTSTAAVTDGYLVKLDPTGDALWAVGLAADDEAVVFNVAVSPGGEVAIAGRVTGGLTLTAPATANGTDGFVARFTEDGTVTWGDVFGSGGTDAGFDVTYAGNDLIVAGQFAGTLTLGGMSVASSGSRDGFVARLDGANQAQYLFTVGGAGDQAVSDVSARGGSVYAAGWGDGTINLGANSVTADALDSFIFALDAAGAEQWSHIYSGPGDQDSTAVAVNGTGDVWLGVSHGGAVDYGQGTIVSAGEDDWVLVKLSGSDGTPLRGHRFGGNRDQDVRALGFSAGNDLFATGDCAGSMDFGTGPLPSRSQDDACIARLPP
ncbi:MAG: hypothetical protein KC731_17660, partial [Myxococcales bacterium]|nr:hypothetical protein [Myxococcales bacterium]